LNIWCKSKSFYKIILVLTAVLVTAILVGCSSSPAATTPVVIPPPTSQTPSLTPTDTPAPTPTTAPAPVTTTTTAAPSPSPAPTPKPSPSPLPVYTPVAVPFAPTPAQKDLMQYVLDLINKDRKAAGVPDVTLSFNSAAQKHAKDMFDKSYGAHWDTDGLKPYMRYTLEGGLNFENENVAYSTGSGTIDVKKELESLQHAMVYDDAKSNWSHRDAIVSKWQKKVSIGIVYDSKSVALDQQFEGDYLQYTQPPTLTGNILSLSGKFILPNVKLDNVTITYDQLPQPIAGSQLMSDDQYHHYSLGSRIGLILPPPPPGQIYSNFPANGVQASKWDTDQSGQFSLQADISPLMSRGKGVYTIVLVTKIGSEAYNMTNYSIFVK
jgi:uncharacterized protein YkwD